MQNIVRGTKARRGFLKLLTACCCAAGGIWAAAPFAGAGTYTWTNYSGDVWSNGANWDIGAPPTNDATTALVFGDGGNTVSYAATDDLPSGGSVFTLNNITFDTNFGDNIILAPDTYGSVLTFVGSSAAITVNGGGTASINSSIEYSVNTTLTNASSSPLTLGGAQTYDAGTNTTFTTVGTSANTVASGKQTFGNNSVVQYTGAGVLTLGTTAGAAFNFGAGNTITITNGVNDGGTYTGSLVLNDGGSYTGSKTTLNLANYSSGTFDIGNMSGISGTINITAGAVAFAGNTGGDLFGTSTILNVGMSGGPTASFDFAGNAESMGGITGYGNVLLTGANVGFTVSGNRSFHGVFSGTGGVAQDNASVFTLYGANTYSGATTIEAGGTIRAGAANALSPNSLVSITPLAGTLDLGGFDQTIGGLTGGALRDVINIASGTTLTIDAASTTAQSYAGGFGGAGNLTFGLAGGVASGAQSILGNNAYTGTTTVNGGTLSLNAQNILTGAGVVIASGATLDGTFPTSGSFTAPLSGGGAFMTEGPGTLTFSTANPGANLSGLSIAAGRIILDDSTDNGSKLGENAALTLGSGGLTVNGNAASATNESFNGATFVGGGTITLVSGSNQSATLNLGAITLNVATGGAVNLIATNTGSGLASITTTTSNNAVTNDTLGDYAVYNGSGWAVATGAGPTYSIGTLGTYTPSGTTANSFGTAGTSHMDITGSSTQTNQSAYDLRFNTTAAYSVTISGIDTLAGGGVLVTSNVGANTSTIKSGTLALPTGVDLIINQFNTAGNLAISSLISGTSRLIKTGPGNVSVTDASNSYSGGTIVEGGSLTITAIGDLGTTTTNGLTLNGGTLIDNSSTSNAAATPSITFGPAGGTIEIDTGTATFYGNEFVASSGTFTKSGAGQLNIGSHATKFAGALIVSQGVLRQSGAYFDTTLTGLTVDDGATFEYYDNNNSATFGTKMTLLTLSGSGTSAGGALYFLQQTGGSAPFAVTINPQINLMTDSRITISSNSTANGYIPVITATGSITGAGSTLTKDGDGTLVLTSANNSYGDTVVAAGELEIDTGSNRLPTTTNLTLGSVAGTSGTFEMNGYNQTIAGLATAGGNLDVVMNSGTKAVTLTVNYNVAGSETFAGQIGGGSPVAPVAANISLVKAGVGTLTLSGVNPYTGPTTVAGGSLRLSANLGNSAVTVNDGAGFIGANFVASTPILVPSLTMGASGTTTLGFEFDDVSAPTNGVMTVFGALTLNGNVNVTITSTQPLVSGATIPLINYASLLGSGFAALPSDTNSTAVLNLPPRVLAHLVNDVGNSSIDLAVTGVDTIKWTGTDSTTATSNGNWNINTTHNWALNSNSSATTYLEPAAPGDNVTFDDSATGTTTVNLTTMLQPAAVTVNTAASYTFSGSGFIAGTTGLTKNGTGTLTVSTANTYSGTTTVNNGALTFTSGATVGGGLTVTGGTVNTVTGAVPGPALITGGVVYAAAGALMGSVTVNGGTLNTVSGSFNQFVTINGGTVNGVDGAFTGNIALNGGNLIIPDPAAFGANTAVTFNGGTLQINGAYNTASGSAEIFTIDSGGGTISIAPGVVAAKLGNQLVSTVAGANTVNITGGGTLNLGTSGTSNVGTINVNNGFFSVTSGRVNGVNAINVNPGGSLYLVDTSSFTLTSPFAISSGGVITLDGDGPGGQVSATDGDIYADAGAYLHTLGESGNDNAAVNTPIVLSGPSGMARFTLWNRILSANDPAGTCTDTFLQPISGFNGLIKDGDGTMILAANNTYSGGTNIVRGTLLASGQTPGNSATGSGPVTISAGGKLGGNGIVAGTVAVNSSGSSSPGGVISAGDSVVTANLTTGAQTWNGGSDAAGTGGGTYAWKLNINNAGNPGTTSFDESGANWDQLTMASLTVNASSGGAFNIAVISLGGSSGTPFDPTQSYQWVIANVLGGGAVSGVTPAAFHLDTSSLNVPGLAAQGFSVDTSTDLGVTDPSGSTDIILSYTPTPEPTSLLLAGLGAAGVLLRRRRSHGSHGLS